MVRSVSFSKPCRLPGPTATVGGAVENALKYENGARLRAPSGDSEEIQAIGRGASSPFSSEASSRRSSGAGPNVNTEATLAPIRRSEAGFIDARRCVLSLLNGVYVIDCATSTSTGCPLAGLARDR